MSAPRFDEHFRLGEAVLKQVIAQRLVLSFHYSWLTGLAFLR